MRLFLDTNVLLDILLEREAFVVDSTLVFQQCVDGRNEGLFCALSACNIVYILRNRFPREQIRAKVLKMAELLRMTDTAAAEVKAALSCESSDFEDEVQLRSAIAAGADVIVTRDKDGFVNSPIPVMTPPEFLGQLEQSQ